MPYLIFLVLQVCIPSSPPIALVAASVLIVEISEEEPSSRVAQTRVSASGEALFAKVRNNPSFVIYTYEICFFFL